MTNEYIEHIESVLRPDVLKLLEWLNAQKFDSIHALSLLLGTALAVLDASIPERSEKKNMKETELGNAIGELLVESGPDAVCGMLAQLCVDIPKTVKETWAMKEAERIADDVQK